MEAHLLAQRKVIRILAVLTICAVTGLRSFGQEAPTPTQGPQAPGTAADSQVVHIIVGHSVIIRTEAQLKKILIGNPAVVTTETTSPSELVVTATAPGSSSLLLWHTNGQSRLIEVFSDLDVGLLRDTVQRAFPAENIQVEAEEGRVILSGVVSNPAIVEQLIKMAGSFTKDVVNSVQVGVIRPKQVMLKVRFAEVDRRKLDQLGINIFSTGAANTIGAISTQQFGGASLGQGAGITGQIGAPSTGTRTTLSLTDLLNVFVFRPDINLGATIKALENKNVLQILAEPNLLAVSGEPARFLAGGELAYPIVQPGVGGQNTVTVQFKPFGVKLDFTGFVEGDSIRLKVAPEVSAVDYTNATTVSGSVLPAISTRRAETVVELKSGQSFGVAGLLDQRTTAQLSKIPGIGDLPILGHLFKSRSIDKSQTELLVIVTPTIVDPAGAPAPVLPHTPYKPLDPGKFDQKTGDKEGGSSNDLKQ